MTKETSDEMVERVARAMYEGRSVRHDDWDELPEAVRASERKDARAAIAAMRTPTTAMASAAEESIWAFNPDYAPHEGEGSASDVASAAWRAMIDAALTEAAPDSSPREP